MRYIYLSLIVLFSFCKKDAEMCAECTMLIGNATANTYVVSVLKNNYTISPGTVQRISVPAKKSIVVFGRPITDKAYSNFNKQFECDDCGLIEVILE